MIEKINEADKSIFKYPNHLVSKYLKKIKNTNNNPIYYEIGIGYGTTVLEAAKILNNSGKIYIFSKKNDCSCVKEDIQKFDYKNIEDKYCSENKIYSGYHFDIAFGVLNKELPPFDLAFLDGGHVFHLDAPTTCILKELCKPGGYIIFDDYNWSLSISPSLKPEKRSTTLNEYESLQIEQKHVKMICDLFMDTDARYKKLSDSTNKVVAYQRILSKD